MGKLIHGYSKRAGGKNSNSPTKTSYNEMIRRCYKLTPTNKNHKYYIGVTVCARWLGKNGFLNFIEDMCERPKGKTLDRIEGAKIYSKETCKWSTPREQVLNRASYGKITKEKHIKKTKKGKYQVQIWKLGSFGTYKTIEEAIVARDSALKELNEK